MRFSEQYLSDVLIRMAYHSSAIEGNTITLPETVSIILENSLPGSNKSIREFYEIENHKQAFQFLIDKVEDKTSFNILFLKDIHALLMDRLSHDRGQFKSNQNAIIGADFQTASPQETPNLIHQWIENTLYRLENEEDILYVIADSHIQFERIHPFSDGNGRVGRLTMMYLSIKLLEVPVIIEKNDRAQYMEILANQDAIQLKALLEKSYSFEKERLHQFK